MLASVPDNLRWRRLCGFSKFCRMAMGCGLWYSHVEDCRHKSRSPSPSFSVGKPSYLREVIPISDSHLMSPEVHGPKRCRSGSERGNSGSLTFHIARKYSNNNRIIAALQENSAVPDFNRCHDKARHAPACWLLEFTTTVNLPQALPNPIAKCIFSSS